MQEKKALLSALSIPEKIIFVSILLFFVFGFYFADLEITSLHGWAFLDAVKAGKILHYYSFAIPYHEVPPVYDIIYYILFGIWELPLWLLNRILDCPVSAYVRIIWCKILLVICYFRMIELTARLVRNFAPPEEKQTVRLWMLLSPFAISIFSPGQYDVVYLVIMMYGFVLLIEKKNLPGSALIFGLAGIFKYFPVMAAVPVFLLIEKRKWNLFRCFCIGIIPMVLTKVFLLYDSLPAVSQIRSAHFKHMFGRLFAPEISLGSGKAGLFIVLYVLICFWAYARSIREDDVRLKEEILYFPLLVYSALFLCILWHGQWLLLLVPFLSLAAVWNSRYRIEIFYASLLIFCGTAFQSTHEGALRMTPFAALFPAMEALPAEAKYTFGNLLTHYELLPMLVTSLYAAGLILLVIFSWPGWKKGPLPAGKTLSRLEIWAGYGIIALTMTLSVTLDLLSVRAERNLFTPGTAVLKNYRPSWKKLPKHFTNEMVVNGIHLMQKQIAPPLCLVPRKPADFRKTGPGQHELAIPAYEGIRAGLKAVHILLTDPPEKEPVFRLAARNGETITPAVLKHQISDRHFVVSAKSGMPPPEKIIVSNAGSIALAEYYLEFNEKGGNR